MSLSRVSVRSRIKRGFTLVELAIVLVIIGLIVTVVLSGQELIRAAELRSVMTQYRAYMQGVLAFQQKYNNYLPGDLNGATFGLAGGSAGTTGLGDQNGILTTNGISAGVTTTYGALTGELLDFWAHLTTPGKELIPGQFMGQTASPVAVTYADNFIPSFRFNKRYGWGVFSISTNLKSYFIAGVLADTTAVTPSTYTPTNIFIPIDAYNIDLKMDDGVPTTGVVQSRSGGTTLLPDVAASTAATADATKCNNTSPTPAAYQYTAPAAVCLLRFEMTNY